MKYMEHELKDLIERSKQILIFQSNSFNSLDYYFFHLIIFHFSSIMFSLELHFNQQFQINHQFQLQNKKQLLVVIISAAEIKCQLRQLLLGILQKSVMHLDLNSLLNKPCTLRIPELIFSISKYNGKIDIWSATTERSIIQALKGNGLIGTYIQNPKYLACIKKNNLAGPLRTIPKYPEVKLQEILFLKNSTFRMGV
ncbi:unnamed protein product [Paramecium sonneborni]|uniref:Uncharacterized protein n=1 Tax=Paramecium sonneborni TaxID=65129 RepID=A0A8S1RSF4_9CILI|nr:unnamed protein product [Paramecium sonneborni]